jgi:hypothetical protein
VPWTAPSISCEDVAAGLLGADALYQASLEEGPEQVESALLGDGQRIPNLARGETLLVAEQLEQLLLFGAQDQLPLFRFRGEAMAGRSRPSSTARTCSSVRGLPSIAVEEWVLRVRVSFWSAGIHWTWTVAARIRSLKAAIFSTRERSAGVIAN